MQARCLRVVLAVAVLSGATGWPAPSGSSRADRASEILKHECLSCHGSIRASGLDLRSREGMLRGGNRGPAVEPGRPASSLLYQARRPHGRSGDASRRETASRAGPGNPKGLERGRSFLARLWQQGSRRPHPGGRFGHRFVPSPPESSRQLTGCAIPSTTSSWPGFIPKA